MRKFLILAVAAVVMPAGGVFAADMAIKAPYGAAPVPYVAAYNWTGFYVGGEIGGGWATEQVTVVTNNAGASFPPGTVLNPVNDSGILGGIYGGYNYQINQIVLGVDGDYTWARLTGSARDISSVNGNTAAESNAVNWISTVTGRLGYAANNWLFFAKGGWASAGFGASSVTTTPAGAFSGMTTSSETRNGWIAGGGVEWGLAAHWSAKLEYDYVKFNTAVFNVTDVTAAGAVSNPERSATSSLNMLKAGLAYRF